MPYKNLVRARKHRNNQAEMGANTSQDQVLQPSEEQKNIVVPHNGSGIHTKAKEQPPPPPPRTTAPAEVKLPHNYEAIVKDADSPLDKSAIHKLYEQLYAGVFLNHKRKKYWVEEKTNRNCFMVFARDLSITWSDDNRYWHWPYLKDTPSEEFVDVAELLKVCWLEVHGKFQVANLSPGVTYQVAFVVMLTDPAYGWDFPVNVRLTLPDGNTQHHKENLMEKPRGRWIEIPVGEFKTTTIPTMAGEIEFSLYEYESGKWKKGLTIKGVVVRPKI